MTNPIPQVILHAVDVNAISQLILTERESRDLGLWNRMRSCFHPDSRVRLSWFDGSGEKFVEGSIDMARRAMLAKHRLGPPLVRLAGNRAVTSISAIIDIPDVLGGIEVQLADYLPPAKQQQDCVVRKKLLTRTSGQVHCASS